jgi:putative endonuclease
MKKANSLILARKGEEFAMNVLLRKNYEILQMNFHSRFGEIDIIAKTPSHLIFVEVKTRCDLDRDLALESVTPKKQKRITMTALHYLQQHQEFNDCMIRYDIILVFFHEITANYSFEHIEDAFSSSWIG